MSIKDLEITDQNVQSVYVQSQPDRLTGTAQQNKAVFDALPQLIRQRFNELLETLAGTGAAGEIPVGPIEGVTAETVQQALEAIQQNLTAYINKIKAATGAAEVGVSQISGMQAQNVQKALEELRKAIEDIVFDPTGGILWSMVGAPNGVAGLDETGKVPEGQLPELDFDPSGSAAAVQRQLEAHTADKGNPHGVTAAQVGAFTKAQTLTAETAALVGLGADAMPDAVFAKIKSLIDAVGNHSNTKAVSELKSYVGTGAYGSSAPVSLSFSFVPSTIIYIGYSNGTMFDNPRQGLYMVALPAMSTSYKQYFGFCFNNQGKSTSYGMRSGDSKTVSWYNTSGAQMQLNESGSTYYFLAIGKE